MKNRVTEGTTVEYLNTGAAISSGDVVVMGNGIGIATTDIAATTGKGTVMLVGVFELAAIATAAFVIGDTLYWDATAKKLTGVRSDGQYAGQCFKAKASAGTLGQVRLARAGDVPGEATGEIGIIDVPLGSIMREDGTALTKQATTVAGFAQIGSKEMVLLIPKDCTAGEELGFSSSYGDDLDPAKDVTLHVFVDKDGALDALTLDAEVYMNAAGDVGNANIQDTLAQTIVATGTELIFVAGDDGVIAGPGSLGAVLLVGGTNDGDAIRIRAVWWEYTKK